MSHTIIQSTENGTTLVQLEVSDLDEGENANYILSLDDDTLPFKIVDNENLTVSGSLDAKLYMVVVVVTDNGTVPLSSNVTVEVQVEPFNNYPPVFNMDPYMFKFNETAIGIGTVFTLIVTDGDLGEPGSANALLLSSEYSNYFNLSSDIGVGSTTVKLVVAKEFDRESIQTFNLTVQAFDTGYEEFRRTSEATVVLTIEDVNDNIPQFTEEMFFAVVGENATVGHQFFQLTASDNDTDIDKELKYSLENYQSVFSVEKTSGWLSVIGTLNRKTQDKYTLSVKVTDGAGHEDNATVNVTVTEVNDYAPQFEGVPRELKIAENSNYTSLNFTVYDEDSELSGEFTVKLEQSPDYGYFELDGTVLSLKKQLDYEV